MGISGEDLQCLPALVPGWPVETTQGNVPEMAERAAQVAVELQRAGLLTTDPSSGKSAHPAQVVDGVSSLLQQLSDSPSRTAPTRLVRLAFAALTVSAILKYRKLEYAVRRVRLRKPASPAHVDIAAEIPVSTLTRDFFRLRPLVYSSRGKCLYDCLVLLEFLSYFNLFPTLVIGVTTFPFNAHCWLQYGSLVLTDYAEHTHRYTPILVV